ncbi:MAG: ribulose-phosphate 3-epimerase [Phycisphaeraceae bacterium JB051]
MLDITKKPDKPLVAVSILSADFGKMVEECKDVLNKGADLLHVDVMDGHFVPNLTMGQDMIAGIRRALPDVYLDVHLMVERPQDYVASFAKAGANMFTFHAEVSYPMYPTGVNPNDLIKQIHDAGMDAGMVINPPTPAQVFLPYIDQVEMFLIMSVVPGASGGKYLPEVLEKAAWLKERLPENVRLEIDGGMNPDRAPDAVKAGIDVIVSASAIFGSDDRADVIDKLKNA